MKVCIIGAGVVGNNLSKEINDLAPVLIDKYKEGYSRPGCDKFDLAFVCVPSPLNNAGALDITEVESAINSTDASLYVIKSTVNIGDTDNLATKLGKRIVFSPEYYGGTHHCNDFDFNFTILGGDDDDVDVVQDALQACYNGSHRFIRMARKEAELVKLMENSWLATKVTFCHEFYEYCKSSGLRYDVVREGFIQDPRVSPSHTFVYAEHPYYSSHCLDKDVPACANLINSELLRTVINCNKKRKIRIDHSDGMC